MAAPTTGQKLAYSNGVQSARLGMTAEQNPHRPSNKPTSLYCFWQQGHRDETGQNSRALDAAPPPPITLSQLISILRPTALAGLVVDLTDGNDDLELTPTQRAAAIDLFTREGHDSIGADDFEETMTLIRDF